MLESLGQSNIKRMAVEKEARPEVIFDPEKNLTSVDRENLEKAFDVVPEPLGYKSWVAFARGLQNLMPDYKLAVEKTAEQFMQSYFDNNNKAWLKGNNASFLADAKETYPKLNFKFLSADQSSWLVYLTRPEVQKRADFVIIKDAMKRLGFSDEAIGLGEQDYNTAQNLLQDPQFVGNEYLQIRMAAGIKRLWPDRPMKIEHSMIEDWRSDLDRQREQNNWRMFAEMAAEMKSLNPDQLEELENNQVVPEQRSF